MARNCTGEPNSALALPHRPVETLVMTPQDQLLAKGNVIQTHREFHQHPVQDLEGIQHVPGVTPADHSITRITPFASALLSHCCTLPPALFLERQVALPVTTTNRGFKPKMEIQIIYQPDQHE